MKQEIANESVACEMAEDIRDSITSENSEDTEDIRNEVSVESENEVFDHKGFTEEKDYAKMLEEDLAEIKREFPELPENFSVTDIKDPLRFGALRDLGLSAKEAYLAVGGKAFASDNRSHLRATAPRAAHTGISEIPRSEMRIARSVFSDMSEGELEKLYRRVSS